MRLPFALAAALTLVPAATQATQPGGTRAFDRSVADTKAAMMADPQHALVLAARTRSLAVALPPSRNARVALATADWLQGEALLRTDHADQARRFVDEAMAIVERDAPASKLHGDLLRSRGAVALEDGRAQEALADSQAAYDVFRRLGEPRSEALALTDIGNIYLDARDDERVLRYFAEAEEVYPDDPSLMMPAHNSRAEAFRHLKRYPEAIGEYRRALADARRLDSPLIEAQILTNLAQAQLGVHDIAAAQRFADEAVRLTQSGDAQALRRSAFGAAAAVAAARGDWTGAAGWLQRCFAGLNLAETDMSRIDDHQLAAQVYEKTGDEKLALAHLKAFQRLDGEARGVSASTNAQLMGARFDFANQNLKISKLKQDQLQRENQLERARSHFRTVLFSGLLGAGALVLALLGFGLWSLRRSRNEVRAANDNLTDANGRLEKALRAKTEFLATTSHEIRTPLNGILGMTQVLLADRRIDPDVRGKVEVVHGAGEAMRALVDDILDVAKMETGQVSVAREETDLSAILADAVRLWSGQAQAKGLALTLSAPDVPARIWSDASRLRQIVFNLMSNATKFTLAGSVELAAAVEADGAGEALAIRVTDTGIGIQADQQELIFEAFRQVDGGVSRQFGGTGLGLAICRRLATAMGGTIGVDSEPGRGSTFTLRLPLERVAGAGPVAAAAVTAPDPERTLADDTVLLVERNLLHQSILRALLTPAAGGVEVAADLESATAALQAGRTGHLLIEAGSAAPDGDPLPALASVAAAARARGAHCSVLFAPASGLTEAALMAAGVSQAIAKPVDGARLIAALANGYARSPADSVAA